MYAYYVGLCSIYVSCWPSWKLSCYREAPQVYGDRYADALVVDQLGDFYGFFGGYGKMMGIIVGI